MGELKTVPRKVDPFESGIDGVRYGTRAFGAMRPSGPHPGVDLFVPKNTPIQLPTDTAVLIGVTRHDSGPGRSMGNALIFFVPDENGPYFVALMHLSPRTFRRLSESDIGSELTRVPGRSQIIAYVGDSASERSGAHLHASVATAFMLGGRVYTASQFMQAYEDGTLPQLMGRRNFRSINPPATIGNRRSLEGYLDPMALIRSGRLHFSSQPMPVPQEEPRRLQAIR